MDKEFEEFFRKYPKKSFNNQQYSEILKPLKYKLWSLWFLKKIKFLSVLITITCAFLYIEFLNENLTAITRIFMIKLLPIWNWKHLHNVKCLIPRFEVDIAMAKNASSPFHEDDCSICENLEQINRVPFDSYDALYYKYFLRSAPVVIVDSHPVSWENDELIQFIATNNRILESEPCHMKSNLLHGDYMSMFNLLQSINYALATANEGGTGWYMHMRNCRTEDVKSLRLILPKTNYYSSTNFETSYSSWLLMSHNFTAKRDFAQKLDLRGMVIVLQLQGDLEIHLSTRDECSGICDNFSIVLHAGESLIFSVNLWNLEYFPSALEELSATVIIETYLLN